MNIKKIFFSQKEILLNGLWIILFIIIMTMAFNFNIFNKNDGGFFENFQKDSESLVVGKILADKFNIDTKNSGLGFIAFKEFIYPDKAIDSYAIYQQSKSFISDENWINGIARKWTGFYVHYSIENEKFFKVGSQIVFKNGEA